MIFKTCDFNLNIILNNFFILKLVFDLKINLNLVFYLKIKFKISNLKLVF